MITTVNAGSGLVVTGSNTKQYISKTYNSNSQHMVGAVMYDLDSQCFKVYDGSMWQTYYSNSAMIEFDSEVKGLIEWAKTKRIQENIRDSLAASNPTIADLVGQIKKIEEQINMVQILVQSEKV